MTCHLASAILITGSEFSHKKILDIKERDEEDRIKMRWSWLKEHREIIASLIGTAGAIVAALLTAIIVSNKNLEVSRKVMKHSCKQLGKRLIHK